MNTVETMNVEELSKESGALVKRAEETQITTNDQYIQAIEFAKQVKLATKRVDQFFDPGIKKAHAAWKETIAMKKKFTEPLNQALLLIDKKGREFRSEQEKIRQQEEARIREQQRKEAEKLEKRAQKAEEKGKVEKAEDLRNQAVQTEAITPVVESNVPKVEGIKVRKIWKFYIEDVAKIPREYMVPNEKMLGGIARSTKGSLEIPGIKFYSEDSKI